MNYRISSKTAIADLYGGAGYRPLADTPCATRLSLRDTPRLSVDNPPFYRALVAVEICTYFDDLFVAGFVLYRIAFVVDLL